MGENGERERIHQVQNRMEKHLTYQEQMKRYNTAIAHQFWFEAIMIDYACLEDRLRYMLYHLGVLNTETDEKIEKNKRTLCFRDALREYYGPQAGLRINSISEKSKIIESIFRMALKNEKTEESDPLRLLLWKSLHDEEQAQDILHLLDDIREWCKYRNEIVHSLMSKDVGSLYIELEQQALEGHRLFRELDKHVQKVKRKNLRKKLGL